MVQPGVSKLVMAETPERLRGFPKPEIIDIPERILLLKQRLVRRQGQAHARSG